jgi:RNA polymerase sigma-70 factor (ECF subfamily)
MSKGQDNFSKLLQRIRHGSREAARELVEVYGPHILRVVRRRLDAQLRSQFDSDDFVQDVWASFFADLPRDRAFNSPEALVKYLVRLARNKVVDAFRKRLQSQVNSPYRARSLDGSAAFQAAGLAARQPTPSQLAIAKEEWDRLLRGQPVHYQRILIALYQGKTQQQVAAELGVNVRTVRRVIEKVIPEPLS